MSLTTIFYCMYFFLSSASSPEVVVFDVIRKNKVIGELKATREVTDGLTHIKSQTKISAYFMIKIDVEYEFYVTMDDNQLLSSEAIILLNGKTKVHTRTKWMDGKYRVEDKKGRIKWISEPITFPSVQLLFSEPKGISKLYSEESGKFLSIDPHDGDSYKKMSAKGKAHYYHYDDGNLRRADMKTRMYKFHISPHK